MLNNNLIILENNFMNFIFFDIEFNNSRVDFQNYQIQILLYDMFDTDFLSRSFLIKKSLIDFFLRPINILSIFPYLSSKYTGNLLDTPLLEKNIMSSYVIHSINSFEDYGCKKMEFHCELMFYISIKIFCFFTATQTMIQYVDTTNKIKSNIFSSTERKYLIEHIFLKYCDSLFLYVIKYQNNLSKDFLIQNIENNKQCHSLKKKCFANGLFCGIIMKSTYEFQNKKYLIPEHQTMDDQIMDDQSND